MNETDPHFFPAMRQALNRLKLAEDWCDMFENVVDMSEITRFGDGPTVRPHLPGMVDPGTAYSRALIYPGATAFAYINEIELRQIRARSRVFAQMNPYAIGAAAEPHGLRRGQRPHLQRPGPRRCGRRSPAPRLPAGARGFPQAEPVEQAAKRDRPPAGSRRRAVPAAVRGRNDRRVERPLRRAAGGAESARPFGGRWRVLRHPVRPHRRERSRHRDGR